MLRTSRCLAVLFLVASHATAGDVLDAARSIPDGGEYNRKWAGSGTPEEIVHDGRVVLAKGDGTYCCGMTLAVAVRVARDRGLLKGKTFEEVKRFQKDWYGVPPSEDADADETLVVLAVERLGIGRGVPLDEAQPGDFVQLWRVKSGHSVIFLGWVEEDGQRVGFRYRSSQGKTDGVGDSAEYFSDAPPDAVGEPRGHVDRSRTYVARLNPAPRD